MDEDKKPAPEAEDAVMQQSYPSPVAESAEAQYYAQLAQHRELERQGDHQPAQPVPHGLPIMPEHQEHQQYQEHQQQQEQQDHHEHHELHQLQGLQETPAPQQQDSRPPDSVDELQLAAQLSQDLAPMMAASAQDHIQEAQQVPQQEGHEEQSQAQAEPNLQEQLEASLQNHERQMQSHEQELQNRNHDLQVVPPHGQAQPHHYVQNPPPPPHFPHHMSMEHLPQAHAGYQMPDATPPRKRSKVSRACDECRRKKIKCDAQSEAHEQPCSNCRRSNAQCLFSRVPQKRGPSKGYIKELADRINTIEGKLNTSVEGLERRASSEVFASPGLGDESRKRPFSSISGDGFQAPSPSRVPPAFTTDHRPILPYIHSDFRPQGSGPADLAAKPTMAPQFSSSSNDVGLQGQAEMMDGINQNGMHQEPSHQPEQLPEIGDATFNRYLEVIHPTVPVLASSKARVQSLLWQSPSTLQHAFYSAFYSLINPFLPDSNSHIDNDPVTTYRLLSEWEAERKPRSPVIDLVRFQTLVMALIAVDCHGIAFAKGQLGGPSKAEMLGRAVGLAYSMRIHLRIIDPDPSPDLDPNSDENVALRAWWVLVMLDRWNAVGTATPTLIGNDNIVTQPGLKHILGDAMFTFIRISYVLGHVVPIAISPSMDPQSHGAAVLATFASGATQMLGWIFPDDRADPLLYLAYWHVRLLSELLSEERLQRPVNILQAARNMVGILACNHELLTPITHHFTTLASLGLLELLRYKEARDEAAKLAKDMLDYAISPSPWNAAVREKLAEYQDRPGTADGTADSSAGQTGQNLQQLADLATAVDGSAAAGPAEETAVGDGLKEGGIAPASNGTAAPAVDGARQEDNQQGGETTQVRVDVRAVLRNGYLNWFDEVKDGISV